MTAAAGSARVAAGSAMDRFVARLQDLMPRRKPAYRRVTPLATRRETQRRAAMAALALIIVVGGLGLAVYAFGGSTPDEAISSVNAGQQAVEPPRRTSPRYPVRASTSWPTTPARPARCSSMPMSSSTSPSRPRSRPRRSPRCGSAWRRAWTGCTASSRSRPPTRFTFTPAEGADPIDLRALVRGPDGAPYVLDRSTRSVYRIDLKNKKATLVTRFGQKANGATVASPRFIGLGATSDLLILDSKNVLWRWRPANSTGKGTLVRINVKGSSSWGDDIKGFGTYLRDEAKQPVQPVRRGPVRAADRGLLAVGGRWRVPGRRVAVARDGP